MKLPLILILLLYIAGAEGQRIAHADQLTLQKKEDTLKKLAYNIINGRTSEACIGADSEFTRLFVKALKVKNSFYYPFDSILNISKLTAPDSSFKIFTWQLVISDNLVRQHGAIQMRTADGSLKLFPLIDKSDNTDNMEDTVADHMGWMGAVYYNIILKKEDNKRFYTLLGYDENNLRSNKKIIEVLTFKNGEPVFGGPFFSFQGGGFHATYKNRVVMEYKKHAGPRLTYDRDDDMIIIEHLVSETHEQYKKYTLVPDGDYEGLVWRLGRWVHIDKVFTYKLKDGEAPVPNPLSPDNGKMDTKQMEKDLDKADKDSGEEIDDQATPASKSKEKVKKKKEKND